MFFHCFLFSFNMFQKSLPAFILTVKQGLFHSFFLSFIFSLFCCCCHAFQLPFQQQQQLYFTLLNTVPNFLPSSFGSSSKPKTLGKLKLKLNGGAIAISPFRCREDATNTLWLSKTTKIYILDSFLMFGKVGLALDLKSTKGHNSPI